MIETEKRKTRVRYHSVGGDSTPNYSGQITRGEQQFRNFRGTKFLVAGRWNSETDTWRKLTKENQTNELYGCDRIRTVKTQQDKTQNDNFLNSTALVKSLSRSGYQSSVLSLFPVLKSSFRQFTASMWWKPLTLISIWNTIFRILATHQEFIGEIYRRIEPKIVSTVTMVRLNEPCNIMLKKCSHRPLLKIASGQ